MGFTKLSSNSYIKQYMSEVHWTVENFNGYVAPVCGEHAYKLNQLMR